MPCARARRSCLKNPVPAKNFHRQAPLARETPRRRPPPATAAAMLAAAAGTGRKRESKPSGSLTRVDAGEPLELLPGVLISSGERWCPQTPNSGSAGRPLRMGATVAFSSSAKIMGATVAFWPERPPKRLAEMEWLCPEPPRSSSKHPAPAQAALQTICEMCEDRGGRYMLTCSTPPVLAPALAGASGALCGIMLASKTAAHAAMCKVHELTGTAASTMSPMAPPWHAPPAPHVRTARAPPRAPPRLASSARVPREGDAAWQAARAAPRASWRRCVPASKPSVRQPSARPPAAAHAWCCHSLPWLLARWSAACCGHCRHMHQAPAIHRKHRNRIKGGRNDTLRPGGPTKTPT